MDEHAELAEHYKAGKWDVQFPPGMYRPPLMKAA